MLKGINSSACYDIGIGFGVGSTFVRANIPIPVALRDAPRLGNSVAMSLTYNSLINNDNNDIYVWNSYDTIPTTISLSDNYIPNVMCLAISMNFSSGITQGQCYEAFIKNNGYIYFYAEL